MLLCNSAEMVEVFLVFLNLLKLLLTNFGNFHVDAATWLEVGRVRDILTLTWHKGDVAIRSSLHTFKIEIIKLEPWLSENFCRSNQPLFWIFLQKFGHKISKFVWMRHANFVRELNLLLLDFFLHLASVSVLEWCESEKHFEHTNAHWPPIDAPIVLTSH